MSKNKPYIWYSGATDITGKKLAEALEIEHGNKKPINTDRIIIGWGTKTKEDTNLEKAKVLNHPNNIKSNRNKLLSLSMMKEAGVNVAEFTDNIDLIGHPGTNVKLPVIGRKKFHQGGKGFWTCPTKSQVVAAAEEGAQYFQNLIEVKDEYRLHTFGKKVIYAVKKVKRTVEEMEKAFVRHEMDRQKTLAEKNGDVIDEKTLEIIFKRQAKKYAQDGANQLVRSNRAGWKFVRVKKISDEIAEQAIKALEAIGLDFGAVDVCTDVDGKVWVFEVNTGPGLEETPFKAYVEEFKLQIEEFASPKSVASKLLNKLSKTNKKNKSDADNAAKERLKEKLELCNELVDKTDSNEEAYVLEKVMGRLFN